MLPRIKDEPMQVHCPIYDAQRTVYMQVMYDEAGKPVIYRCNGCNDASNAPECKECMAQAYSSYSGKVSATH